MLAQFCVGLLLLTPFLVYKNFIYLLCNIFQIIPTVFCLWSRLTPEDTKVPKLFGESEFPYVIKYSNPGPFESLYDYPQNSDPNSKGVGSNNGGEKEKFFEMSKEEAGVEKKVFEPSKPIKETYEKKNNVPTEKKDYVRKKIEKEFPKMYRLFREEIKSLKVQIRILKKMAKSMENLNRGLENLKREFSPEFKRWMEKIFGEQKENENKMSRENRMMLGGSGFRRMNNVTYNNQYQIGAIFIINRLSEEKEDGNLKLNRYKGTESEIFNNLTDREMKELLLQTLNNLNSNRISHQKETPSINESEINLLKDSQNHFFKQLQSSFLKMFRNYNITLKELSQMSKVVDFVERYHGIIGNLASIYDFRKRKAYNRRLRGRKNFRRFDVKREREVKKSIRLVFCCRHGINLFKDTERKESRLVRRKRFFS